MTLDRIVVAVDGSPGSARALDWAVDLAFAVGAEVVAVHALGLLDELDPGHKVPAGAHREEIRRRFEGHWCAALDDRDVRTRRVLRDGAAVPVLLAVAAEVEADLVVLGSRGLGGFPELLLGSTSTQVAQRSPRPVAIIPGS
jgi:nucleotide-binding universal stress UspA family protein